MPSRSYEVRGDLNHLRPSSYETYLFRPTGFYGLTELSDLAVYLGKWDDAHPDQENVL